MLQSLTKKLWKVKICKQLKKSLIDVGYIKPTIILQNTFIILKTVLQQTDDHDDLNGVVHQRVPEVVSHYNFESSLSGCAELFPVQRYL